MPRGNKGGILIYVLGMITLLSIVVTEFLLETASAIRYRSQIAGRQDLEIIADSALETSKAVLNEIKELDKGLFSPIQGWADPIKYFKLPVPEGYTIKVTISDETGKLSIYEDGLKNFGKLLDEMGYSAEVISNLKTELKKYLDKLQKSSPSTSSGSTPRSNANNEGQERGQRSSDSNRPNADNRPSANRPNADNRANADAGSPQRSEGEDRNNRRNGNERNNNEPAKKERTLFNLEQLKEIPIFEKTFFDEKGNPNDQFKVLKQNVSILNTGKANINTAPELVKKVLAEKIKLEVPGKKYLKSIKDLKLKPQEEELYAKQLGFNSSIFNIEIEAERGPVKYHVGAIMEDKKPAPQQEERESRETGESESEQGQGSRDQSTRTPREGEDNRRPARPRNGGNAREPGRSNGETERPSTENGRSEEKNDFSFLALTEDNSFIN